MTAFVRFIFIVLVLGSTIAFGIVVTSDWRAQQRQAADTAREKALFAQSLQRLNGHLRHGELAVEWQKVDANQQPLETSVLVRIYRLDANGHEVPLPLKRVVIPKNRICVQGMMLNFDESFPKTYEVLRGTRLAFFQSIYADGQTPEQGLILMKDGQVPRSAQVHPDRLTQYELRMWQYLWFLLDNPEQGRKAGLTVTRPPVAARALANGTVYSIYMGLEGTTIVENNDPGMLNDMRSEAARMDAEGAW